MTRQKKNYIRWYIKWENYGKQRYGQWGGVEFRWGGQEKIQQHLMFEWRLEGGGGWRRSHWAELSGSRNSYVQRPWAGSRPGLYQAYHGGQSACKRLSEEQLGRKVYQLGSRVGMEITQSPFLQSRSWIPTQLPVPPSYYARPMQPEHQWNTVLSRLLVAVQLSLVRAVYFSIVCGPLWLHDNSPQMSS